MTHMRASAIVAWVCAGVFLSACDIDASSLETVRDRERDLRARLAADAIADGEASDASAGPEAAGVDAAVPPDVNEVGTERDGTLLDDVGAPDGEVLCDPNEAPDEANSVFVSAGVGGGGDGSMTNPFASLAAGIDRAITSRRKNVVLDFGTYAESLSISANVTLRGGWRFVGNRWRRQCGLSVARETEIQSPLAVAVEITGGNVTISQLSIVAAPGKTLPSGEGESSYGIWVAGTATTLRLEDVAVRAGRGGDGLAEKGTLPATATKCSGIQPDCATSGAGNDGADGANGADGKAYGFTSQGYVAGLPAAGIVGAPGKSGAPGQVGEMFACVIACGAVNTSTCSCAVAATETRFGGMGICGCGGSGGKAGLGGHNGGASIAVLVTGGALLTLERVELSSADGGSGTEGAAGTEGESGTRGAIGSENRDCFGACSAPECTATAVCSQSTRKVLAGGAAGTDGGHGGRGGSGGAGVGGPSYAVAAQRGSKVDERDGAKLSFGNGGEGGRSTLKGPAGPKFVEP